MEPIVYLVLGFELQGYHTWVILPNKLVLDMHQAYSSVSDKKVVYSSVSDMKVVYSFVVDNYN